MNRTLFLFFTIAFGFFLFPSISFGAGETANTGQSTQKIVQPPDDKGVCHFVLVTIPDPKGKTGDCSQDIGFYEYLNAAIDQLVPLIMIIALIMITFSGFQYMMGGAAGDVKSARARITGILGAIIFFFLVRLILNQIAPNLDLKSVIPPVTVPTPVTKQNPPAVINSVPGPIQSVADTETASPTNSNNFKNDDTPYGDIDLNSLSSAEPKIESTLALTLIVSNQNKSSRKNLNQIEVIHHSIT